MRRLRNFLGLTGIVLLLVGIIVAPRAYAADPPAKWHVALLHVTYSDTKALYTHAQLVAAAGEIHRYFLQISYGQINLEVTPVEVTLSSPREFYFFGSCTKNPCASGAIDDAAQAAAAGGFSFSGIDGIGVLSTFCSRDFTHPQHTISRPSVSGTFGYADVFECNDPAPGPSGVNWGAWAHEIGHQLEIAAYGDSMFKWNGHPSGYKSGYDLMDSCYPCDAGAYSLLHNPIVGGTELVFGGWLRPRNVVVVNGPSAGTTAVLTPLEEAFTGTQAIQVPIAKGKYYLVEARRPILSDKLQNKGVTPRGIYDTGVKIVEIEESAIPPETPINACDTTVAGGCIYHAKMSDPLYDPRAATCSAKTRPADCWPFDLWHVGNTYTDSAEGIAIKVESAVGNGFAVTVTRGVPPGHPNLFIVPWLTPPMNTYETEDIWVDSSCNGYESVVGPKGLLYGRRADGTVIGNGDDPCANHENRIYANVHNIGDAVANNVVVHFQVTNPLGVGVTGSWTEVGKVTIPTLSAGATKTVYVNWKPVVSLSAAEIVAGVFKFHSCVQVIIDPVKGEIVKSDNSAQENFDNFSAVRAPDMSYPMIHGQFFVTQTESPGAIQTVLLNAQSALPKGWTYKVADGVEAVAVGGNTPILKIPADIQIPKGTPVGKSYELGVQGLSVDELTNLAIPATEPVSSTHLGTMEVGGVVLSARGVLSSGITLAASANSAGTISASGKLNPAESAVVAVDFTNPDGAVYTRYAETDAGGNYACTLPTSLPQANWHVRAFWQGDLRHTGVVSRVHSLVIAGNPNQPPLPLYAKCGNKSPD
jgi:hypothetical protein